MKKKILLLTILSLGLSGCTKMTQESYESRDINYTVSSLEVIPDEYKLSAKQAGVLEKLDYSTYESFTYEEKTRVIEKSAYVYLTYGYNQQTKYNIFYLMHGGWSNETSLLGTPENPSSFKNILDHAIMDNKIDPLIIVCPTYNNTSSQDSSDYSLALQLTNQYHNELVNDLIPAVENQYSTYANDTSFSGLQASRDHRAFGGFSMGSVATWHTFEYCLDYFRYFIPMSGSFTSDGSYFDAVVKKSGYDWNDFFIYSFSGTDDFAYDSLKSQIESMKNLEDGSFRYADNERKGNLYFQVKQGGVHDSENATQYTYNALVWLFKDGVND